MQDQRVSNPGLMPDLRGSQALYESATSLLYWEPCLRLGLVNLFKHPSHDDLLKTII